MARKTTTTSKRTSAPARAPPARPAAATPGFPPRPAAPAPAPAPAPALDAGDQQRLLDVFARAFADVLASPGFPALLRDVKRALFERDFAAAFRDERRLEAYAARWSPTRALCYAAVLLADAVRGPLEETRAAAASTALRVLSVGGCAAEHVALAAYVRATSSRAALTLLDAAPWSHVMSLVQERLCATAPTRSGCAEPAAEPSAEPATPPFVPGSQLSVAFCQHDVLSLPPERLAQLAGPDPLLVTLLFTLNELYTDGGLGRTTGFLRSLGEALPSSSLLLVVDSPGSYSEAAVGRDRKRYPTQWLLNHTLLDVEAPGCRWERLASHDSLWFRLPGALSYPIQLEDMRYQMHLYRIHKP